MDIAPEFGGMEAFRKVLQLLDKVSYGAQSLKLWAKKNGLD